MNEHQKKRFAKALERVAGDEDMLSMLATIAVEDAPPMMESLDTSITKQSLDEAAKTAHSLKGLLSAFETDEPVSDLQPLIDAAKKGDQEESIAIQKSIQPKLETLLAEINAIANG